LRIAPEPAALLLCGVIARLDVGRRLTDIPFEHPGQATFELLEVCVDTVDNTTASVRLYRSRP
jgi:hypothetical protein